MLKEDIIKKSPIRVLEKSLQGGLGSKKLGVFTARKGVGKTASLVHISIDKMMRGQKVLHLSFADDPHHIENWYEQVFDELSKTYKLEDKQDAFDEIIRNRLILHLKNRQISYEEIKDSIARLLRNTSFDPATLIIDGFDFDQANPEKMIAWRDIADLYNAEMWFSATLHREELDYDKDGIPSPVNRLKTVLDVIIMLNPLQNYVDLVMLKCYDETKPDKLPLKLDPSSLLIANHRI